MLHLTRLSNCRTLEGSVLAVSKATIARKEAFRSMCSRSTRFKILFTFRIPFSLLFLFPFFFSRASCERPNQKTPKVGPFECDVLGQQSRVSARRYPVTVHILLAMAKGSKTPRKEMEQEAGAQSAPASCSPSRPQPETGAVSSTQKRSNVSRLPQNRQQSPVAVLWRFLHGVVLHGVVEETTCPL